MAAAVRALRLLAGCALLLGAQVTSAGPSAPLAQAESCRDVRLADIGWTDVTATTALLATILRDIGYRPAITVLSVPVTFAAMKHGDIDVFLGNWMPAQAANRRAFLADGSLEIVRANLTGARYTLATPAYSFAAGLRSFADIARFGPALGYRIYGIEPGNDGNRHILEMVAHNSFNLGSFTLVESSEQAMLAQVERAYHAHAPIVFLAWDPHPMNLRFELRYLPGGDAVFGPNFGGATVYTLTRAGLLARCPNLARLLRNLAFTPAEESELMAAMLDQHASPETAARNWLSAHPAARSAWLAGVYRADGRPALAVQDGDRGGSGAFQDWVMRHKIPVGEFMTALVEFTKTHGTWVFAGIAALVRGSVGGLSAVLRAVPSPLLLGFMVILAWLLRRSLASAAFVALALLFIMNQGYWPESLETLSLVLVAAAASSLIGIPLGVAAAHRPRLYAALRPLLDLMQTLPTFVYLIPTLVLFGLGVVPGLISTVIFALPAPLRMTQLGISRVPRELLEAGEAFGATRLQLLWKVELPSAAPSILAGLTQCIMLSLSMVVIAALVGAGGLGVPVVRALNTVQVGTGFEAGLVIVLLAIILERLSRPRPADNKRH